jgi:two-component system, chemotaxis family, protein-glutamate methylesterase/glutaminase
MRKNNARKRPDRDNGQPDNQPSELRLVTKVQPRGRDIVVVGASAGGLEALENLIAHLPGDLPAALFVVQHLAPDVSAAATLARLEKHPSFNPKLAEDGETFEIGKIYLAPPDRHLLVKEDSLVVRKGAFENRHRPAIDPLFRSAAVAHGPHVIGVILTGMLDDGANGLLAIQKCGGISIVQDPGEAAYPALPQNALANVDVDYCVSLPEIAPLLESLTRQPVEQGPAFPEIVVKEAQIAERVLTSVDQMEGLGALVPHTCPACGGNLWRIDDDEKASRYRCFTGHSFSLEALFEAQSEKIEETLWIALRMFEDRKSLLSSITGAHAAERAQEIQVHIDRIRTILLATGRS